MAASIVGIEVNALVAVAAALALGAAIGAVTGVIVARGRVQAFIATLVMMLLLRGVTMVYTNGSPINTGFSDNADLFGWFGIRASAGDPDAGMDHGDCLPGGLVHAAPYSPGPLYLCPGR
ncbi:ribose ABC transport system [Klebsiella pneumoniae subsp. ozaenae]|uniref:Ribose ABC transport system n=1 Tax=Klebsiella pneumoniae subsp. ozaenae TaxID=574 RepID=A0A378ARN2_KLEPO|nr:ribose ABC transport system [Klebsiella pneumoniae subsp. ozaenae]